MPVAPVRWGIMGTANIARSSFLPGLRAAGGTAEAVASRQQERAEAYAHANGVARSLGSYQALIEDPTIEAVYIALPNSLHAAWTIAALQAGKPVLCEKPLCLSVQETARVLGVARSTGTLLWEAFVFPFRQQTHRLEELIASGMIGEVREVQSNFHFSLQHRENIRLRPELGGGALYDVGCYPIRLGTLVFGASANAAVAVARWTADGVDDEMQALYTYPGALRLGLSCGMFRRYDTFTRVLGTAGEIRLTNPFHPGPEDEMEIISGAGHQVEPVRETEPSFTNALRHINAAIRGEEEPVHLAVDEAMPTAVGLALGYESAREHREEEYRP